MEQEALEGAGRAGDAGERRGLVVREREGLLGGGQERAAPGGHGDRLQRGEPRLHERGEGRPAAREGGPQLLHRDAPPCEQVLEDGPPGVGPRSQRRERLGGPGRRGREFHAAAGRTRGPLARVQPGREGGAHELAGRGQVVVLGPADEPEERRGERGELVEDGGHVLQLEPRGRHGGQPHHVAGGPRALSEGHGHPAAQRHLRGQARGDAVGEGAADGGGDGDLDEHGAPSVAAGSLSRRSSAGTRAAAPGGPAAGGRRRCWP